MARRLPVSVLIGMLVVAVVNPSPASATNDTGFRVPNGQNILLFNSSLDANFMTEMTWVRANVINPTDVQTIMTSNSAEANIRMGLADYPGWPASRWGEYQCMASFPYAGVNVCTDGRVRFHTNRAWDSTNRRDLACHEMGHALGLAHRGDGGCMQDPVPYGAATNVGYGTHSLGHINTWY